MIDANRAKEPISMDCLLACLYFVCLPFTIVTTPFGSLLKVVTMPVIAILGIRILMGKSELAFNYIQFFYAIYILYTVMLLFVFSDEMATVTTKDMVLGLLMMFLITIRIYNSRERELMETAWVIMGVFCIFVCLGSTEVVSNVESRAVIRVFGFEEDQNQFCAYFIMPVLISLKRFIERRKGYLIYLLIIILAFYAILKTGSRGGLIGVFAGAVTYIVIGIRDFKIKLLVMAAAAAGAVLFWTVVMPMLPEDVAMRYSVEAVTKDGGTGRLDIWKFLIEYTMQRPERLIRGSGIFSTYGIMQAEGFKNGVAHNAFVQLLNDQGTIGIVLFSAVGVMCILRNIKKAPVYACAFISLMAFSMSLSFYVFKPYLNIMMMCAMSFLGELPEDRLKSKSKIHSSAEI